MSLLQNSIYFHKRKEARKLYLPDFLRIQHLVHFLQLKDSKHVHLQEKAKIGQVIFEKNPLTTYLMFVWSYKKFLGLQPFIAMEKKVTY